MHNHFGLADVFKVLLRHLRMNVLRDGFTVVGQHVMQFSIGLQIGFEVRDCLPFQAVDQVGMLVIGNVVEADQLADDVGLKSQLADG